MSNYLRWILKTIIDYYFQECCVTNPACQGLIRLCTLYKIHTRSFQLIFWYQLGYKWERFKSSDKHLIKLMVLVPGKMFLVLAQCFGSLAQCFWSLAQWTQLKLESTKWQYIEPKVCIFVCPIDLLKENINEFKLSCIHLLLVRYQTATSVIGEI